MRNLKKQINEGAEKVSEALQNLLLEFRPIKLNLNQTAMRLTLVLALIFANVSGSTSISESSGANAMMIPALSKEEIYVNSIKEKFQDLLVTEVKNYITELAPESQLTPEYMVKKCIEYNTDIIFVLSQAILESHLGTKGKAAKTNSVWNVGTYDDGQILYTYKTPNESLEPYLKLVNEKYLINVTASGDTIFKDLNHLVQDRGYINYRGNRFASARGYENGMRKLMVKIDMETSISFYQEMVMLSPAEILAYFAPFEKPELDYASFQAMN